MKLILVMPFIIRNSVIGGKLHKIGSAYCSVPRTVLPGLCTVLYWILAATLWVAVLFPFYR